MDKNSLMASLMTDGPEQDLFGDVPIDGPADAKPPLAVENGAGNVPVATEPPVVPNPAVVPSPNENGVPAVAVANTEAAAAAAANTDAPVAVANTSTAAPAPAVVPASSLLAESGLLGTAGGGGMFDAVDEEEKKKAEAAEQERQRKIQAEEAARLQLQQEEEQERQRQLLLQQQQQQQQQQQPYASQQQPGMYATQQQQQQQNSAIMQSVILGNTAPQQQQTQTQESQQLHAGMQNMTLNASAPPNPGFYREHPPAVVGGGAPAPGNAYGAATVTQNQYYYTTQQQQQQPPQPNITAGMHNATPNQTGPMMHPGNLGNVRQITLVKPEDVQPIYHDIKVTEPMLIQQQTFLISAPPYWSYQISSNLANNQGTWLVRRRFRHVVALEDRLRQACPGSILPARPDKHATRALEEASTQQSAEFAIQRAQELQQYLNAVAKHPVAGQSQVLRLFLGLQDDIGTAWPEVSGNAFTKLGAVAAGMSMKVAETTQLTAASAPAHEWEDDAELLTLCSSENIRMGAVTQAVPKLEGAVTLLREQGDSAGALGMEMSKVTKQTTAASEDFKVCDVLSNGLLRHGRRTKRLALELSASMDSFLQQYKMVRYEKMAMHDRRQAIQRKGSVRRGADQRAMYLAQQQRQLQAAGQFGQLNQLEQSAIYTDSMANNAVGEAEEIAARLKSEIHRVAIDRRTQWNSSMKAIAVSMKEACAERLAIWESTLEAMQSTPGLMPEGMGNNGPPSVVQTMPTGVPSQLDMNASAMNQMDTSTIYA